jgi:hypothetical protein
LVEEASWFSPNVVVLKKNIKFRICVDFLWLNAITKKGSYPLPLCKKKLDEIVGHDVYSFLD